MKNKRSVLCTAALLSFACALFCFFLCKGIAFFHEEQFYEKIAAVAADRPDDMVNLIDNLTNPPEDKAEQGKELLARYGYRGRLFSYPPLFSVLLFLGCFAVLFGILWGLFFLIFQRQNRRIRALTDYLNRVEQGEYPLLPHSREDEFSHLEDRIYKTVVNLRESREASVAAKEHLSENLADISHQLKTPLTSVSLMGEVLLASFERNPTLRRNAAALQREQETAQKIVLQNERMASLVSSLLTLSKLDAGALPLHRREISAEELLECSVESVRPLAEQKELSFRLRCEAQNLFCDFSWTCEAISNLLKNCCEHAPKGSEIEIEVSENPIFLQIIVADCGPGFDPEDLPHLFERFYRGKHAAKDSIGIGLALAKSVIERQDGDITAQNRREGSGAKFIVKFYKNVDLSPNC